MVTENSKAYLLSQSTPPRNLAMLTFGFRIQIGMYVPEWRFAAEERNQGAFTQNVRNNLAKALLK